MLITDYATSRHLASRLELGVDHHLCKQRIGQTVEQIFSSICPDPQHTLTKLPALTAWEDMSVFYQSNRNKKIELNKLARTEGMLLTNWWLEQLHTTRFPLWERMTLFWHNHFVSGQKKVKATKLLYIQNQLFRKQALGNFGGLLHAVSKDPAMLIYLDSASNRKDSPNENFAREVMELFTLGVGNYTEQDIKEAARAFTGWSVDRDTGEFMFRKKLHDNGQKTILGKTGNFDGDDVLDISMPLTDIFEG